MLVGAAHDPRRHEPGEPSVRHTKTSLLTVVGLVVLAGAVSFASPAAAANPHVASAEATMSDPVFGSPNLTWDTGLDVGFIVAGLGNNPGVTVTLNAHLTVTVRVVASTGANGVAGNLQFTDPFGFAINLNLTATAPGSSASFQANLSQTTPTLTSDKNRNVKGTLAIPGSLTGSLPDNTVCVQISWTQITLTIGGTTFAVPDVLGEFDSNGSFCS